MKIIKYILPTVLFALCACAGKNASSASDHDHHEDEIEAHDHDHDHDHDSDETANGLKPIELDTASQALFEVKSEVINPGDFHNVIPVSGQIVSTPQSASVATAPTSGIVRFAPGIEVGTQVSNGSLVATISSADVSGANTDAAAKSALDIAKKEIDRITPLYKEGLVTAKDYNEALQAYEQAKALYSPKAASGRATAATAGVITNLLVQQGQFVEAGTPIAEVNSTKRLTLRADVPVRYQASLPSITSANVIVPGSGEVVVLSALGGSRLSKETASSTQNGYSPIFFSFNNNGMLSPGAYVEVQLIGTPRSGVITVPAKAISEQQGHYFVYRRLDEDCFQKIPVTLGVSDGKNVEIISGLSGGEDIVTNGAAAVRLAETATVAPEGHTHNH